LAVSLFNKETLHRNYIFCQAQQKRPIKGISDFIPLNPNSSSKGKKPLKSGISPESNGSEAGISPGKRREKGEKRTDRNHHNSSKSKLLRREKRDWKLILLK